MNDKEWLDTLSMADSLAKAPFQPQKKKPLVRQMVSDEINLYGEPPAQPAQPTQQPQQDVAKQLLASVKKEAPALPYKRLDTTPVDTLLNAISGQKALSIDKVETADEQDKRLAEQEAQDQASALSSVVQRNKKYQDRLETALGEKKSNIEQALQKAMFDLKKNQAVLDYKNKLRELGIQEDELALRERAAPATRDPVSREFQEMMTGINKAGIVLSPEENKDIIDFVLNRFRAQQGLAPLSEK